MKLPFDPYLLLFYFDQNVVSSPYFKLIVIAVSVFVFVVLLALVRKHIFHISLRGAVFGFVVGIIVMLLFDLIVLFGLSDKEKLRNFFTQKNRQEATAEVVSSGVANLSHVLGTAVTVSPKKTYTKQEIIEGLLTLPDEDTKKIRDLLCPR